MQDIELHTIPKRWTWDSLDRIVNTLESGNRPKGGVSQYSSGVPSIGGEHLSFDGTFNFEKIRFVPRSHYKTMKKGRIKQNDILIVKDGATTGKTSIVRKNFPYKQAAVNEHVFILRPNKEMIIQLYLFYYLSSTQGQFQIKNRLKGSAQGGINSTFIQNFSIPVPPLNEQKKIVAKIESIFAQIDAQYRMMSELEQKLQSVPDSIAQLKHSILGQAFKGKLIHQDSNSKSNISSSQEHTNDKKLKNSKEIIPKDWMEVSLSEIAEINPKPVKNLISDDLDVSFVPMKCVEELTGKINLEQIRKYSQVKGKYTYFRDGDILFAKITPCMENGKIAIASGLTNKIGFGSTEFHVIRITNSKILTKFYFWYLLQEEFRQKARSKMKGTAGQLRVTTDYIKNVTVLLPPLKEQKRIVAKIESIFSRIDAQQKKMVVLESQLQSIPDSMYAIKSSVLKKAFEGKLVFQNLNNKYVNSI